MSSRCSRLISGGLSMARTCVNGGWTVVAWCRSQWDFRNLAVPPRIATGAETVAITYELSDPAGAVQTIELTIADNTGTVVVRRFLTAPEKTARSFGWNGATTLPSAGWATFDRSPFAVALTATDRSRVARALNGTIAVSLADIQLTLGNATDVRDAKHAAVVTALGALPAPGNTARVVLPSFCFSDGRATDFRHDDGSSFTRYQTEWGDGPPIPIVATVRVFDSRNNAVAAAHAVGRRARLVWDYSDEGGSVAGLGARPAAFVGNALDYEATQTVPPGRNCHADFGGKRGGGGPILLTSGVRTLVSNFSFNPTRGTNRTWSVFGQVDAHSRMGVVFRPSRMAGDSYRIHAHLQPHGTSFDHTGAIGGAPLTASTGVLAVWRSVAIAHVYLKKDGVDCFRLSEIQPFYDRASIQVVWDERTETMPSSAYRDSVARWIAADTSAADSALAYVRDYGLQPADSQYGATAAAAAFRDWDTFVHRLIASRTTSDLVEQEAVAVAYANAGGWPQRKKAAKLALEQRARGQIVTAFRGVDNTLPGDLADRRFLKAYRDTADLIVVKLSNEICLDLLRASSDQGVFVFGFKWGSSFDSDQDAVVRGKTLRDDTAVNPTAAGYIQYATAAFYRRIPNHNISRTVAHEIGHTLFLPHTEDVADNATDGEAHDRSDDACVMGYHYTAPREFCGYCLLRLRGWDHRRLAPGLPNRAAENSRRPKLAVTQMPVFPAVAVAGTTPAQNLVITNQGTAPLVVTAVAFAAGAATRFALAGFVPPQTVAATATLTIPITYRNDAAGAYSDDITITSNDRDSPHRVTLGATAVPAITLDRADLDGGIVYTDAPRRDMTLTITNSGAADLRFDEVALEGGDAASFAIHRQPAAPLAAAASDTIVVRHIGTTDAVRNAVLRVVTNAAQRVVRVPITIICHTSIHYTVARSAFAGRHDGALVMTVLCTVTGDLPLKFFALNRALFGGRTDITITGAPAAGQIFTKNQTFSFDVVYRPSASSVTHQQTISISTNAKVNHDITFTI